MDIYNFYSYKNYQVGYESHTNNIYVSRDLFDDRYKKYQISSDNDAIELIDNLMIDDVLDS